MREAVQFGRLPSSIVAGGWLRRLSHSELRVYVVLVAHIDGKTWTATPGMQRIADLTGLGVRTVQRTVKKLAGAGLIDIEQGGGRRKTNRYTLNTNPSNADGNRVIHGDTVSETNPVTHDDTVSGKKPRQTKAETLSKPALNPVTLGDTRTEEQKEQSATRRARPSTKKKTQPGHRELVCYFSEQWATKVSGGVQYAFDGGKDAKAAKHILDSVGGDLDRARLIVDAYLDSTDTWLCNRGKTLAVLASGAQLPRVIASTATKPAPTAHSPEPVEHNVIRDARARGWGSDVEANPAWWAALVDAVETGTIENMNTVKHAKDADAAAFRARLGRKVESHVA